MNQYWFTLKMMKEKARYIFDDKLEEWMEENLKVEGRSR